MEADALLARQIARLRGDSAESRAAADLWDVAELPERLIEFLRKLLADLTVCSSVLDAVVQFAWVPPMLNEIATTGVLAGYDGVRVAVACCAVEFAKINRPEAAEQERAREWARRCLDTLDLSKALPDLLSSKSLPELMARPYAFRSQKIVGTLLDQANRVIKRFEKNRSEGHEASISEMASVHQLFFMLVPLLDDIKAMSALEKLITLCLRWDVSGHEECVLPAWFFSKLRSDTVAWSRLPPTVQAGLCRMFPEMFVHQAMDDCRQYLLGAGVETKSSDTRKSLEGTFWFNTVIHDRLLFRMIFDPVLLHTSRAKDVQALRWLRELWHLIPGNHDRSQILWNNPVGMSLASQLQSLEANLLDSTLSPEVLAVYFRGIINVLPVLEPFDYGWIICMLHFDLVVLAAVLAVQHDSGLSGAVCREFVWRLADMPGPFAEDRFALWAQPSDLQDSNVVLQLFWAVGNKTNLVSRLIDLDTQESLHRLKQLKYL